MKYFVILIIFITAFGIVASIVKYTYDSFLEEDMPSSRDEKNATTSLTYSPIPSLPYSAELKEMDTYNSTHNGREVMRRIKVNSSERNSFLNLSELGLRDLSPLSGLKHLRALDLKGNKIVNLEKLSGLSNVVSLDLKHNHLSDIAPLAQLSRLNTLWLQRNKVENIEPFIGLSHLQILWLGNNLISNLKVFEKMKSKEKIIRLGLAYNKISNVTSLGDLSSLQELYLTGNPIDNFRPLSNLKNLTLLDLRETKINQEQYDFLRIQLPNCEIRK